MPARTAAALAASAALLLHAGAARADVVAMWLQAHGGVGGTDTSELAPGGDEASLGGALGLQAGLRFFLLEGYVDRQLLLRGGSLTRAILGLRGALSFADVRLVARGGLGRMTETRGALIDGDLPGLTREGWTARLGAAVEMEVRPMLLVGFGLDGEYYVLDNDDPRFAIHPDLDTGFAVFGTARVTFELGF
jgi:hypothetical protein